MFQSILVYILKAPLKDHFAWSAQDLRCKLLNNVACGALCGSLYSVVLSTGRSDGDLFRDGLSGKSGLISCVRTPDAQAVSNERGVVSKKLLRDSKCPCNEGV